MVEVEGQDAAQVAVQLVTASWKGAHYLQRLCCRKIVEPLADAASHLRPVPLLKSSLVVEEPPLSITLECDVHQGLWPEAGFITLGVNKIWPLSTPFGSRRRVKTVASGVRVNHASLAPPASILPASVPAGTAEAGGAER